MVKIIGRKIKANPNEVFVETSDGVYAFPKNIEAFQNKLFQYKHGKLFPWGNGKKISMYENKKREKEDKFRIKKVLQNKKKHKEIADKHADKTKVEEVVHEAAFDEENDDDEAVVA